MLEFFTATPVVQITARQEKFRIADADGNGKLEGEDAEKKGGG